MNQKTIQTPGQTSGYRGRPVRNPVFGRILFLTAACIGTGMIPGPSAMAQSEEIRGERRRREWDPSEYVQRLDRDGDGQLSPNEMGGRSRSYIGKLGLDPSKPVPVESILSAIEKKREREKAKERRAEIEANRLVPGFEVSVDRPKVPGFELNGAADKSDMAAVEANFGEAIVKNVRMIMERYDSNGDGFLTGLTGEETKRLGRWVDSVEEADVDGDHRLSPMEIANGIKRMEQRRNGARTGNGQPGNSGVSTTSVTSSTRSLTPSRQVPLAEKARKYVGGLFKDKDKNRDNRLDAGELKSIKLKFRDTDGDGTISRAEAIEFVSSSWESGGSVSPAARAGRTGLPSGNLSEDSVRRDVVPAGRTQSSESGRRFSNIDSAEGSREFRQLDKNGDRQLQMIEFGDGKTWNDDLYEEFLKTDSNGDGVITADEFDG